MSTASDDDWDRPPTRARRGGRWRGRRRLGIVAAVAVVGTLLAVGARGGLGVGLGGDPRTEDGRALRVVTEDDDEGEVRPGVPGDTAATADDGDWPGGPEAAAADQRGLPGAGGVWRDLPPAPVRTPLRHAGAWTGTELVVVGADRAAAYDPDAEAWRLLPRADVVPQAPLVVAWTGREVLAWGEARPEAGTPAARGARYDPTTRTWRRTAWLEIDLGSWPVALWTDDRLVVWGADEGAAYDPRSDSWQPLAPPPLEGWQPNEAVWTGKEVVVWGDARTAAGERREYTGFTAAYDPVRDEWRFLAPSPVFSAGPGTAVWTGSEVVVLGGQRLRDRNVFPATADLPAGAVLDVATGTWRIIGAPPGFGSPLRMEQLHGLAIAWTGEAVVAVGGYPQGAGLRYDPATDRWSALPSGPVDLIFGVGAWTGDRFLVWGGYGPHGPDVALRSWEPD